MEKLEIYRNDNYVLNDAFDQSVMNIHILKKQKGYKSFVVCGCETGDGTTTVAINLAAALASSGWNTVLVDGDMRKKNRYKRLSQNVTVGLSDFLLGRSEIEDTIYETTTDRLFYIPCGELIDNPVRLLCSGNMNDLRDELDKRFDYIIFDMPAMEAAMDAKVVAVNADATILVSSIGKTSKKALVDAANSLAEVKANLVGTIVNKMDMDQYKEINEEYDYFQNERYAHKKNTKNSNRKSNIKKR